MKEMFRKILDDKFEVYSQTNKDGFRFKEHKFSDINEAKLKQSELTKQLGYKPKILSFNMRWGQPIKPFHVVVEPLE